MGRPKGRQEPRTTMSIRVSADEKRRIEEKAHDAFMEPSAYVREMALNGGKVDLNIHEDRKALIGQLAAIGNNINQVAHQANISHNVSDRDIKIIKVKLAEIYRLVSERLVG